ncbi:hypothetical protein MnTg04_00307 [bacterium MnTg04]|nr:hypothetical protein MnTg04_00307 [bacterium MnTg04]
MNLERLQYAWWNLYTRDLFLRGSEFLVRAFLGALAKFFLTGILGQLRHGC